MSDPDVAAAKAYEALFVPALFGQWAPRVLDALAGTTLSTAELRRLLAADDRLAPVISMLCDEARLVRDRPTGSRRSSAFRYRRWDDVLPGVDLASVPEASAIELLVRSKGSELTGGNDIGFYLLGDWSAPFLVTTFANIGKVTSYVSLQNVAIS